MTWLAWDQLILPKSHGGMGFRDMRAFNQALLSKQARRLIDTPGNLCTKLPRPNIIQMITWWTHCLMGMTLLFFLDKRQRLAQL
jgi:hypothetical protein